MSEELKDKTTSDVACEPAGGYALVDNPIVDLEPEIDYDFDGKDFGYARTLEELEFELDEADAERSDPSKWVTTIELHSRIESKYPWLR